MDCINKEPGGGCRIYLSYAQCPEDCPNFSRFDEEGMDLIKWMGERAEGFSVYEESGYSYIQTPSGERYNLDARLFKSSPRWEEEVFPLLLTRAIEGVNRIANTQSDEEMGWAIDQEAWGLTAYIGFGATISIYAFAKYESEDQAKKAALEYVREQEKKK